MHAFKLKHPVPDLQPIGSVSLLGATPTAGDPQVAGAMIYGEPQDAFTCGLFSSTEGSFTMTYPFTEHATVLEGEVELTVAGGEPQRFTGTHSLGDPAWLLLDWLQHVAREHGSVPAGTVVTTGTWCGCMPLSAGDRFEMQFEGLGQLGWQF